MQGRAPSPPMAMQGMPEDITILQYELTALRKENINLQSDLESKAGELRRQLQAEGSTRAGLDKEIVNLSFALSRVQHEKIGIERENHRLKEKLDNSLKKTPQIEFHESRCDVKVPLPLPRPPPGPANTIESQMLAISDLADRYRTQSLHVAKLEAELQEDKFLQTERTVQNQAALAELQRENKALIAQCYMESLRSNQISNQLDQFTVDYEGQRSEVQRLARERDSLAAQVRQLSQRQPSSTDSPTSDQTEVAQLRSLVAALQQTVAEDSARIRQQQDLTENLVLERNRLTEQIEELRQHHTASSIDFSAKYDEQLEVAKLNSIISALQHTNAETAARLLQQQNLAERLLSERESFAEQVQQLRKLQSSPDSPTSDQTEVAQLKSLVNALQQTIGEDSARLRQQQDFSNSLMVERDALKEQVKAFRQQSSSIEIPSGLEAEVVQLKSLVTTLQTANVEAELRARQQQESVEQLKKERDDLAVQLEDLNNKTRNSVSAGDEAGKFTIVSALQNTFAESSERARQQHEQLICERDNLQEQVNRLRATPTKSNELEVSQLKSLVSALQQTNAEDVSRLRQQRDLAEDERMRSTSLLHMNTQLETQVNQLNSDLRQYQALVDTLNKDKESLFHQIEKALAERDCAIRECQESLKHSAEMASTLRHKESCIQTLEQSKTACALDIQTLKHSLALCNQELESNRILLNEREAMNHELKQEIDSLFKRCQQFSIQLHAEQQNSSAVAIQLAETCNKLQRVNAELLRARHDVTEKETVENELRKLYSDQTTQLILIKSDIERVKTHNEHLTQKWTTAQVLADKEREEKQKIEEMILDMRINDAKKGDEAHRYRMRLEEVEDKCSLLEERLRTYCEQIVQSASQIDSLNSQIRSLHNDISICEESRRREHEEKQRLQQNCFELQKLVDSNTSTIGRFIAERNVVSNEMGRILNIAQP